MSKLKITGGARIGWAYTGWPWATLKVNEDKLELNASIIGNLVFRPEDIISIEPYYPAIPFRGPGIRINHSVANYNSKVIFWTTFRNPPAVINQIIRIGFLDNIDDRVTDTDRLIIQYQESGALAIKRPVAIGLIASWIILFAYDILKFHVSNQKRMSFGKGLTIAIGILFLVSTLSLVSKDFSKLILKEGRSIKEIRWFLYAQIFFSGLWLIVLLAGFALGLPEMG